MRTRAGLGIVACTTALIAAACTSPTPAPGAPTPVVAISPSGPTVNGNAPVRVTVASFAATKVDLYLDRVDRPPIGTDTTAPYDFMVNGVGLTSGAHTLLAVATGPQGTSLDAAPFQLPAPLVNCYAVTYTPFFASTARLANLCVPSPHRDVGIVLVHGGGGVQGDRYGEQAWSQRYLAAGYVTLSIDYFLFDATTPSPVYPQPERDVKSAIQYLRRNAPNLGLDPERIVIEGNSAGARLSAEMFVSPDDPYFAGNQRWPVTSDHANGMIGFYGPYNGAQQASSQYYGGPVDSSDPAVRDRWARANSVSHAALATGPVLLFQGDADATVPLAAMAQFSAALGAAGKSVEAHVVTGGTHGYDNPGSASGLSPAGEQSALLALAWLDTHFPAE